MILATLGTENNPIKELKEINLKGLENVKVFYQSVDKDVKLEDLYYYASMNHIIFCKVNK